MKYVILAVMLLAWVALTLAALYGVTAPGWH